MDCKATNPGIARGTRQQVLLTLSKGKSKKTFPQKLFVRKTWPFAFFLLPLPPFSTKETTKGKQAQS